MANTLTGDAAGQNQFGGTTQSPDPNGGKATVERTKLVTWTLDTLQRMRNFRRPFDQRRAYFYKQYIGIRDRRMYPDNLTPRSNTFVPYPKSNVDAVVSRVHDAFF